MRLGDDILKNTTTYTLVHLKQLLIDIQEHGQGVCVRFRTIGEMWQPNFVRVVNLSDNRILVNDEVRNKLLIVNLTSVMQFEVDHKFKGIEPHYHYNVTVDAS
jgi:hypothetical protein